MATRGRKKRKRTKGAGTAVKIKPHSRSPRGPNSRKPRVRVDPYRRGKPAKKEAVRGTGRRRRRRS